MSPLCCSRGKSQGPGATTSPGCPYPAPRDSPQPNLWPRSPCESPRAISFCPSHTTAGPVLSSSESCPAMGHTNPGPPVGPPCPPVALRLTRGWNGPLATKFCPMENPRYSQLPAFWSASQGWTFPHTSSQSLPHGCVKLEQRPCKSVAQSL